MTYLFNMNLKNISHIINKLALSFVIFLILLAGCTEKNLPPTALLEITPTSGEVPLQVNIKLSGDDPDGIEDITQYKLTIGTEVIKSATAIDLTRTFVNVGPVDIYGEVTDSENQFDKTSKSTLTLLQGPYIEQSAALLNDNEIAYSATVYKKASAQLEIKKDGVSFLTQQLSDVNSSGADYQKTFKFSPDGIIKGDYQFILKSDDLEKTNSVEVPNYKPTTNLSGLDTDLNEGVEKTITLPTPFDKNPEDNPVPINSVTSLDGKTQVTLNGNNLKINPLTYTGDYQVEVEFGTTAGGLEKAVLNGKIIDDPRIFVNPFVQPNDTTKAIFWNNLDINQRIAHFEDRLYNYDKTDTLNIPGWVCSDYVRAWKIAFHGYPIEGLENNNWHNIPGYDVTIRIYNKPTHASGGVNLGDDVADINDWRIVETQNDSIYTPTQLKEFGAYEIEIEYTRVIEDQIQGKILDNQPMIKFVLNNNGDWVDSGYRNSNINLVETKEE